MTSQARLPNHACLPLTLHSVTLMTSRARLPNHACLPLTMHSVTLMTPQARLPNHACLPLTLHSATLMTSQARLPNHARLAKRTGPSEAVLECGGVLISTALAVGGVDSASSAGVLHVRGSQTGDYLFTLTVPAQGTVFGFEQDFVLEECHCISLVCPA
jgi:hypothetical protein